MTDFAGFASFGTTVRIDGVNIAGPGDITGPQLSTDVDDTTTHDSPNRSEQCVATVKRIGTIAFPMRVKSDDPGQQDLYAAYVGVTINTYVITKPSGIVYTFDAYCTGFGDSAAVTGHESIDIVLTPTAWPDDAMTFPAS